MILTQKGLEPPQKTQNNMNLVFLFKELFTSKNGQNKTCKKNILRDLIT